MRVKTFRNLLICLLVALFWLQGCSVAEGEKGLEFNEAWVRAMPPGMKMTAGFGKLVNLEATAVEIVSFSSPMFADVSLHRTELVDGVSKMREVPVLAIAAGETVELAPGGYHLMLMMPSADLGPGQAVTVEMKTVDGRVFSFDLPVRQL